MSIFLRKATKSDLASVLSLYKSALGTEGCTWNEYYPTEENISEDFSAGCLYVLEADGLVIGAAARLYKLLGFTFLGTTHVYGNDYYICEKIL